jgi:hypothetical protein
MRRFTTGRMQPTTFVHTTDYIHKDIYTEWEKVTCIKRILYRNLYGYHRVFILYVSVQTNMVELLVPACIAPA